MSTRRALSVAEASRWRKPLLAYDGSPEAEEALDAAIGLVSASHGRLTILSAVSQIPYLACTGAAPEAVAELRRSFIEDAERVICRAVERVPRGIPVTKIVSSDPVEHALLRQTSDGDHDLLVLGSRGRGPIRSMLFGSVGRAMLRQSPVPVLVVANGQPRSATDHEAGSRIAAITPTSA
jgi:nucleotide-binding universal stress UspA family protein